MTMWRALILGIAVGTVMGAVSCGKPTKRCLPSNCAGCCNNDDACVQSATRVTCGLSGVACVVCDATQQCVSGACSGASASDGGTGGGTAGGGSAVTGGGTGTTGGGRTGGGTGTTGGGRAGGGTGATGGGSGTTGGGTGATGGGSLVGNGIVINEIDCDQPGNDSAEFVELLNTSAGTESLTNVSLVLVNGATNTQYLTVPLASFGSLGPGEYFVIGSAPVISGLPSGVRSAPWGTTVAVNNLQNGDPDGVALMRGTTMIDSVSYGGDTFLGSGSTAVKLTEGSASTLTLSDTNNDAGSIARIPNGSDTNENATDFVFTSPQTPGYANQ